MRRKMKKMICFCALAVGLFAVLRCETKAATVKDDGKLHQVKATTAGEYHKLIVKKSSFILVDAHGAEETTQDKKIKVTCLKKNKKTAVSKVFTTNAEDVAYFCLKPGTYYLKVKSTASTYVLQAVFENVKDSAGASQKKAKTIQVGSRISGIIYNTDSAKKEHWYHFKLKKAKKVKLSIVKYGGKLGRAVYGPDGAEAAVEKLKAGKKVKLPAGDYYILIAEPNKKATKEGAMYEITLK
jgi:hypothetical protein